MSLLCLSFSHHHVPIAFREKVHFDSNSLANACARFRCGDGALSSVIELAILSTCNRTELYVFSKYSRDFVSPAELQETRDELIEFVALGRGVTKEELIEHARWYDGPAVSEHLSRVACGLESLVLGEPQVLGQVGDAMRMGLAMNASGPVLTKLFQTAIRSGRRARAETQINNHSLNIATVAVNTATKKLGDLSGKTVLLLGAGEMAELALAQLVKLVVTKIQVVNRTIEKGNEVANRYGGTAYVFEQLGNLLPGADILISSTGAPHTLLTRADIEQPMRQRPDRPLMILDIAVPRDVEISVNEIENVERCDVDDLEMATGKSMQLRREEIPQVEEIIRAETDRFLGWIRTIGIESTVVSLRQKADRIRRQELELLAKSNPKIDSEAWEILHKFSQTLVNKVLRDPTVNLRQVQGMRAGIDYGEAIRELFELEVDPEQQSLQSPQAEMPISEDAPSQGQS